MNFLRRQTFTRGFSCLLVALGGLLICNFRGSENFSRGCSSQCALEWPADCLGDFLGMPESSDSSLAAHKRIKAALQTGEDTYVCNHIGKYIRANRNNEAVCSGLAGTNPDYGVRKALRVRSLVNVACGTLLSLVGVVFVPLLSNFKVKRGEDAHLGVLEAIVESLLWVFPISLVFFTSFFSDLFYGVCEPNYLVMAIVSKGLSKKAERAHL